MAKAKLKRLGYTSPAEGLGEKFHVNPGVLQRLNRGKSLSRSGTEIVVPDVLVPPPSEAAQVVVNGTEGSVTAFDFAGKLLSWYVATTGSGTTLSPWAPGKSPGKTSTRSSTTTPSCSGTPPERSRKPRSRPARIILSEWSGSICRRSTTGFTALRSLPR